MFSNRRQPSVNFARSTTTPKEALLLIGESGDTRWQLVISPSAHEGALEQLVRFTGEDPVHRSIQC